MIWKDNHLCISHSQSVVAEQSLILLHALNCEMREEIWS